MTKIKVKSLNWGDDEPLLEGVGTKEFYYDVAESGLRNALFMDGKAHILEPAESLELARWLYINSTRGQLSQALMMKDSDKLNEITKQSDDFIEEIRQANKDFNPDAEYKKLAARIVDTCHVRKLAMAACTFDNAARETILSDPDLMNWLKDAVS